jgi:hypothetical protein
LRRIFRDEAVDGDLQNNDRSEHAALEALARELGEEAFDRVAEVGVKWNVQQNELRASVKLPAPVRL